MELKDEERGSVRQADGNGIRYMELKVNHVQSSRCMPGMNPLHGVESTLRTAPTLCRNVWIRYMELKETNMLLLYQSFYLRNPLHGVERDMAPYLRALRATLMNPLHGVESSLFKNELAHLRNSIENPLHGVERDPDNPRTRCDPARESVTWSWKPLAGGDPFWGRNIGIRYMELKDSFKGSLRHTPAPYESVTWSWKIDWIELLYLTG